MLPRVSLKLYSLGEVLGVKAKSSTCCPWGTTPDCTVGSSQEEADEGEGDGDNGWVRRAFRDLSGSVFNDIRACALHGAVLVWL